MHRTLVLHNSARPAALRRKMGKGRDEGEGDPRVTVSFSCVRETSCELETAKKSVRPTVPLLCPPNIRGQLVWLWVEQEVRAP